MPAFEEVEAWLLEATAAVASTYFQLPIAGQPDAIYRERVYCYELYHQWRARWREGFDYSLGGEVDKAGHPIIRGGSKPDFLVHRPGLMDNLLVVEVKPGNGEPNAMAEDLIKLCHFRGLPIDYRHAIFLLYGLPIEEWDALQMRIARVLEGRDGFNPALVSILVHESAGTTAQKVDW